MRTLEVDTEIDELRTRIEKLEDKFYQDRPTPGIVGAGKVKQHASAGIESLTEPITWKHDRVVDLPPFLSSLFNLPYRTKFDLAFESKTWACNPEPLILYFHWNDPAVNPNTVEFYRLHNQTFTITKVTDPNTGIITCTVMYNASLKASGLGKSHVIYVPNGGGVYYNTSVFVLNLKNDSGAVITSFKSLPYSIYCDSADHSFTQSWNINPGLYDLITGATWQIEGDQDIDGC